MRLPASLAGLLTVFVLLMALFAAEGASAARPAASASEHGVAGLSNAHRAGAHQRHDRALRRKLGRTAHGKRAVADNVGLTSLGSRAKARAKVYTPAPAAASTAGLLFNGAHISDFALMQAAPGAVSETPDPAGSGENTIEMTVDDTDVAPITPTENPRAQLLSPAIIDNGDEFWISTKFLVPANFPTAKKGWMSLVSIYGAPFGGSSPWQIEIVDGRLQWMRNGTYHWDVPWQQPLIKGSWVSVLLHERFASDGFVEMWINGQPISFFGRETRLNMQTMDSSNNGGGNSAKIMQYREAGMFSTASLYFGALKIGLTRESVGG
jgi:Polysaccharide lyase